MNRKAFDKHPEGVHVADILPASGDHRDIYMAVGGAATDSVLCRGKEQRGRRRRTIAAEGIDCLFFYISTRLAQLTFLSVSGKVAGNVGGVLKVFKQPLVISDGLLSALTLFKARFLGDEAVVGFTRPGAGSVCIDVAELPDKSGE